MKAYGAADRVALCTCCHSKAVFRDKSWKHYARQQGKREILASLYDPFYFVDEHIWDVFDYGEESFTDDLEDPFNQIRINSDKLDLDMSRDLVNSSTYKSG